MSVRRTLFLLSIGLLFLPPLAASDWPMFHYDLTLSGVGASRAPDTNALRWAYQTGAIVEASPVVAGGKVFVGNRGGRFMALDQWTGAVVWSITVPSPIQGTAAVSNGIVYFLATNGVFYARNAADGSAVWDKNIASGYHPWDWASPAVHNGNVFIAGSSGFLYSLNAATGAQNWVTAIGGTPDSPLSIGGGKVFSGTHNFNTTSPTMVAVDETTGAIAWTYDYHVNHGPVVGMVNSNGAAVADADGDGDLELFFGVYNWGGVGPQLVCLDAATGSEIYSSNLFGNSTSTPAVHNGRVFIGSDSDRLFAFDATNGAQLWSFATGADIWAAPVVSADGKVCVGSMDHKFYCVNEATGALIWQYDTGASRLRSSPALSNGILYVGNENGRVYAFGADVPASVDFHPQSCPNPFNAGQKGVTPVAIVGGAGLDVTDIDLSTIRLAGVAPVRASFEDVTRPAGAGECACTTDGPDGIVDLTLKFDSTALAAAIGTVPDRTELTLTLTGQFKDGAPFSGTDCVRVLVKGK